MRIFEKILFTIFLIFLIISSFERSMYSILPNLSTWRTKKPFTGRESVSRYTPHPAPRQQSMKPRSLPSPAVRLKTNSAQAAKMQNAASSAPRTYLRFEQRRSALNMSYASPRTAPDNIAYAACSACADTGNSTISQTGGSRSRPAPRALNSSAHPRGPRRRARPCPG